MHGNVYEWCQDCWRDSYAGLPGNGAAWITSDPDAHRVRRGGSWEKPAHNCRSAFRGSAHPDNQRSDVGLRLVLVDDPRLSSIEKEDGGSSINQGVSLLTREESDSTFHTISRSEAETFIREFVKISNKGGIEGWIDLYADNVDYYDSGIVSRDFLVQDKLKYFERWPVFNSEIKGEVTVRNAPQDGGVVVDYAIEYTAASPSRNARASGEAHNVMTLKRIDGELRIIAEKQIIISRDK